MDEIYAVIRGPHIRLDGGMIQAPGLGSVIKDELGSYVTAVVSATHSEYPNKLRELLQNPEGLLKMRHKS